MRKPTDTTMATLTAHLRSLAMPASAIPAPRQKIATLILSQRSGPRFNELMPRPPK